MDPGNVSYLVSSDEVNINSTDINQSIITDVFVSQNDLEKIEKKHIKNTCQDFDLSKVKFMSDGSDFELPSNILREYKYIELENGLRILLISDMLDMEVGIGFQYPISLLDGCKELGGVKLISNIFLEGLKEYFREVTIIKSYTMTDSKILIQFSTTEEIFHIFYYFSEMISNFDISMDKFVDTYEKVLKQYYVKYDSQYSKIIGMLYKTAHEGSYLKSSCPRYSHEIVDNREKFDLLLIKKRIVSAIREGISSNLMTFIITLPCCFECSQYYISNTLNSIKNLNKPLPNILNDTKYIPAFSTDNLIGKRLKIASPYAQRQYFFCFSIDRRFKSNLLELEGALSFLFIRGENSLATHLKNKGLIANLNIKILLYDRSPVLSFIVDTLSSNDNSSGVNTKKEAEILSIIRKVVYTFTESPLLESYVNRYFNIQNLWYSKHFATSSTDSILNKLSNIIEDSPIEGITNIMKPDVLLDSVESILSYSTFDNFFLIDISYCKFENIKNNTVEIENIGLDFWNLINADLIPSYVPAELEDNPFLPKSIKGKIINTENVLTSISKIDFHTEANKTLIDPYNDRISFSIARNFQRPSNINYLRFNIIQDDYFSIKSILFKCFIAFLMNLFLRPYRDILFSSSVDIKVNCGLDNIQNLEFGYDSLSVYLSSHSDVFQNVLNLTSASFNNATSLSDTSFVNLLNEYKESVVDEYSSSSGISYARSIVNRMLDTSFPSYQKYIKILGRVTYADYLNYCDSILGFNRLKGLIAGNILLSESKILFSNFVNSLNLGNLSNLEGAYDYNLPHLVICPQPDMPRHFLINKEQIQESSSNNLVYASVVIENSIRNVLILKILEPIMINSSETALSDKVNLVIKWELKKHYIQLNIISLSPIRYTEKGNEPIVEYATYFLRKIFNLGKHIELKQRSFFSKSKRILTISGVNEEERFDQLYYSYMTNRRSYMTFSLIDEFNKLTSKDISNFSRDIANGLTYIIILSSSQQTNKYTENEIVGFTVTDGYPDI
ncbi:insulinase-like peptidase [Cryptosporidium felis]|nr:insulinase-like peptidase [Cryptosporidium felis]